MIKLSKILKKITCLLIGHDWVIWEELYSLPYKNRMPNRKSGKFPKSKYRKWVYYKKCDRCGKKVKLNKKHYRFRH